MPSETVPDLNRIWFSLVIRSERKQLVETPTECDYIYDSIAIHCIQERVQTAFFRAPFDGSVAWSVQFSESRALSDEVTMSSIGNARRRLESFIATLREELFERAHRLDEYDEDAVTLVRPMPVALRAGGE
jgi:hypothetical protein